MPDAWVSSAVELARIRRDEEVGLAPDRAAVKITSCADS
jgi:hypothetical protein